MTKTETRLATALMDPRINRINDSCQEIVSGFRLTANKKTCMLRFYPYTMLVFKAMSKFTENRRIRKKVGKKRKEKINNLNLRDLLSELNE